MPNPSPNRPYWALLGPTRPHSARRSDVQGRDLDPPPTTIQLVYRTLFSDVKHSKRLQKTRQQGKIEIERAMLKCTAKAKYHDRLLEVVPLLSAASAVCSLCPVGLRHGVGLPNNICTCRMLGITARYAAVTWLTTSAVLLTPLVLLSLFLGLLTTGQQRAFLLEGRQNSWKRRRRERGRDRREGRACREGGQGREGRDHEHSDIVE